MAPRVVAHPGTRPTERLGGQTVDTTKDSAPAHPPTEEKKLAALEKRLVHELMDDEERQELRDRILRLRQRQED
jgi:hypothetical protein